ncbi:Mediator of RNA polymerase II transcription subunit 6 [Neocucurbitaria cava]|uniref:Mediator of RNA polymerase II transcription subunit 6 n=1 Tax=Neocucurbitaria cava TaxID=798079 RepID=A0A9W8Y8E2_9PLEO|nr:Mediator of RNA polymerase II transcription subunit 6 [Neocucurbitaria cava]
MPPPAPLPDEQEFDQPPLLGGIPNHDINFGNNPFYYFTSSPWFEPMCINVSVLNNLGLDPDGQKTMNDRKLWDERLRRERDGVQFMIVGEPQGEGQPWVLQRQNKVPNPEDNKKIDTHAEGTWYFQGTRVLMAPSLLDVMQSRLLSISTRMQQMAEISRNMTHWSPATGYSYFPPSYEGAKAPMTTASRIGSPTLAPTDPDAAASQSQGAGPAAQAADPAASSEDFSDALFMQSLSLTNAYGDEFMDENPLKGEPGAFVFENTRTAVDARNKAQEQANQASSQPVSSANLPKLDTQVPSVAPSAAGTPKGVATPAVPEALSRKGSIAPVPKKGKKDRAKSQGLTSPTTPAPSVP